MSVILLKAAISHSSFASAKRVDGRCRCKKTSKTERTVERSFEQVMMGDLGFSSTLLSTSGETVTEKAHPFKQILFWGAVEPLRERSK